MEIHLISVVIFIISLFGRSESEYNPCCSYPCQNQGVCVTGRTAGSYSCDCSNLDFYGTHCETPTFWKKLELWLRPDPDSSHHIVVGSTYKWIFDIINSVEFLHDYVTKKLYLSRANILDTPSVYEAIHDYPTISANTNASIYARTLPPVPLGCPTPMGTAGKKDLPSADVLIEKFFVRKQFRPDPMGSSVLMTFFAQHFTHMFFKTDLKRGPGMTWTGHGVDLTSYYGKSVREENLLRSFKDGKLKMQELNGELYPMNLKDIPGIEMTYPPNIAEENRFALGHPFFGLLPGLFLYQTIWMREHNRVCEILKTDHPDWDDEHLFQTTKLVLLGETIKITIEDYVNHLANYNVKVKYKPQLLFGEAFQYQNKINIEFNHLYHWHPLMPDEFYVNETTYSMKDYMFHSELVIKHGTASFTEALSTQRAGQMSHHNHGPATLHVLKETILEGRQLRLQSLNNYRRRFNIKPFASFEELTGETEMAAELRNLYGHIEAVEFYVGILLEKRIERGIFGGTIIHIGAPFSVKGLLANPISSPQLWKPSTFGGDVGFNIVKKASLRQLFCDNIPGKCPLVSFRVPNYYEGDVDEFASLPSSKAKDEL